MVVIASAITTKGGKTLLSRQFVAINKARIEGLLAAFPKLMSPDKEHTFVETQSVRYVYQPLENLYILLITNKTSNILEDLETLHLMAKIVPEFCHTLDEPEVMKNAFEIIFAFDEALAMGYKERVTMQQIKHFLSMESHDEVRAKAEQEEKEKRAHKEAEKMRKEFEKKRGEDRRDPSRSMSSSSSSSFSSSGMSSRPVHNEPIIVERKESREETPTSSPTPGKGLQLGKSKKQGALAQVLKEENVTLESEETSKAVEAGKGPAHGKVHLTINEKLVLAVEKDGGVENLEVKGELSVSAYEEQASKLKVYLNMGKNDNYQFKTHPNMNKNAWTNDSVLALKDPSRGYPLASPTGVLKWRFTSKDENHVPIAINAWPTTSGDKTTVPIEFEKKCPFDLYEVTIAVPIPGQAPVIEDSTGSTEFDLKKGVLFWRLPLIDSSSSTGSLEFTVPSAPHQSFFPIQVSFTAKNTFCQLQIAKVTSAEGDSPISDCSSEVLLEVEQFEIK